MEDEVGRLLARTRARREALNSKLSSIGEATKDVRSPLKEKNTENLFSSKRSSSPEKIVQKQITVERSHSPDKFNKNKDLTKIIDAVGKSPDSSKQSYNREATETKTTIIDSPILEGNKEIFSKTVITEKEEKVEKTEVLKFSGLSPSAKKKIKCLKFIDEENDKSEDVEPERNVSRVSPLKKEEKSSIVVEEFEDNKTARKKRLANLAEKFNEWEDDTEYGRGGYHHNDHNNHNTDLNVTSEVVDVDEEVGHYTSKSSVSRDPSFISSLKAQGYEPSTSKSKLVYDFTKKSPNKNIPARKHPPVVTTSPTRGVIAPRSTSPHKPHPLQFISPQKSFESGPPKPARTYQQPAEKTITTVKMTPTCASKTLKEEDSSMSDTASRRSISEKRSMFEESLSMMSPKKTDPALLSMSERKALFEKNKTCVPKPVARFGESVTPAMLSKAHACTTPNVRPEMNNAASEPTWKRKREQCNVASSIFNKRRSVSPNNEGPDVPVKARLDMQKKLFENGHKDWRDNDIAKQTEEAKKRDMDVILNRFVSTQQPPKDEKLSSPERSYPGVNSLKKVEVSPPKPGNLYPDLTGIIGGDEPQYRSETAMSGESVATSEAPSLGTAIKRVASSSKRTSNMPSISEDTDETGMNDVSVVSEEIDDMLDEALDDSELAFSEGGPTPPKMSKSSQSTLVVSARSPTTSTTSWEFQTPKSSKPSREHDFKTPLVEGVGSKNSPGLSALPEVEGVNEGLLHSVSFYRKQKPALTPVVAQKIVRNANTEENNQRLLRHNNEADEDVEVARKNIHRQILKLQEEAREQEQRMEQASKALNYCVSKDEFEGSYERVEGERLLLEAFHKHSAALSEVQRLKSEGAIGKATPQRNKPMGCKGSVSISGITLPLKADFVKLLNSGSDDFVHYFVCLVKFKNQVIATQMLSSIDGISKGKLHFPNLINIRDLDFDFQILLEVYGLQTRKEFLTHEAKYHIRKEKSMFNLTPLKKLKKQESSRMPGPRHQNPVNSKTIRRPSFGKVGYAVINIDSIHRRKHFSLSDVPSVSPLEGELYMNISAHSESRVEQRGFLTIFKDVNGFGDWSRRWCLLSGNSLRFWKYPEDESKEEATSEICLSSCITDNVTLAPKEVCSRMNTFMLETQRRTRNDDNPSLVMHINRKSGLTRIRHLLMADTRDERISWCNAVNCALVNLRSWDPTSFRPRTDSVSSQDSSASSSIEYSSTTSSVSTDIW